MNDFLKLVAPNIGKALLGPLGGIAASFIAEKMGIEEKTVEAVTEAINGQKLTPEQLAGIKQAEIEFQKFLKTHEIDLEKIAAADRDGARRMQIETRSHMPAALTILITFGFFGVLGAMFMHPEVKESAPLMIMLGSLGTAWTTACAFWFGTTVGSQRKTALIAQADAIR